jgi:predicted nucleic acid-binding protein
MTGSLRDCVVDASVGIKLVLQEEGSAAARAVFAPLGSSRPPVIAVPDLFFIECANILWKNIRRGTLTRDEGQEGLHFLTALALSTTPTTHIVSRALEIAASYAISAYDAAYLSLSEQLGIPLVTADARLVRSVTGGGFNIVILDTTSP